MVRHFFVALAVLATAEGGQPGEIKRATAALSEARAHLDAQRFAMASWSSPELAANRFGDPGEVHLAVQLPRREAECLSREVKCWLVFYLPGFDSSAQSFEGSLSGAVSALDRRTDSAPIVVVVLDGRNRLGGGWYVDSNASGSWESLFMRVLLPAARDALAPGTPPSRTLVMGHSMGGFGALHLASTHPKAFGAVAAFNPAADLSRLGEELVRKLPSDGGLPDFNALLEAGSSQYFYARILVTLDAALNPDSKFPHDIFDLVDSTQQPWRLRPSTAGALARFDLTEHPLPAQLRAVIFAGARDPLIPPAALEAMRAKNVELVVTPGNHLSHLAPDFAQALEELAH
jgi:pimeloyl-ACP methyl ester carboxylesterase